MCEPNTIGWLSDWWKLPPPSRMYLECRYDGPIPHQAIIDELRAVKVNAPTVEPLIASILAVHGMGSAAE